MIIGFLIVVTLLVGVLAFIWYRLAIAPKWERRWVPWVVGVTLGILTVFAFEGFDVWGGQFSPATMRPIAWIGQAFLALVLYLFLGFFVAWLIDVGIRIAVRDRDRSRDLRRTVDRIAAPLVLVAALGVVGFGAIEARDVKITHYEATSAQLPEEFDGMTVALITDIHAGAVRDANFTRGVVDLVNEQKPDLIVVVGDLEDGTAERYAQEVAPVADLRAPMGVYATTGNHEMFRDTANWIRAFEGFGLTMLQNQSVPLTRGGATITLAGVHDYIGLGQWMPNYDKALADAKPDDYTLFLAHQPLQAEDVQGRGVDLQLSGHTHGGQMWPINYLVPLQQPVLDGFHTVGDVPVITSRGAGAWGPAIRIGAPPEVPIITLRRS